MSVRKRKWITRSGEAREAWIVDYVDQQGDRHIETFERKKEADEFHDSVRVSVKAGTHTPNSKSITVAEAGERWIKTGENNGLERATLEQYRQHLDHHIVPNLGRVKLSQLTKAMVKDFEDSLRDGRALHAGNKKSPAKQKRTSAMTKKILTTFGSVIADAQEDSLVSINVVREGRSRRRKKAHRAERRQKGKLKIGVDIPTPKEIRAIVTNLSGRWRPILLTAIFTGLRASELRGLRWSDVHLENRTLTVNQKADRYGATGPTKTEAGVREVPLPPIIVNTLREWKVACPRSQLDLVFPNGSGGIEDLANIVQRGLQPAQVQAGLTDKAGAAKYTGMHALRHFYASWCINRKADGGLELPPKTVQARLGHSTIMMTMDTYGHLFPSNDDGSELVDAENRLLA